MLLEKVALIDSVEFLGPDEDVITCRSTLPLRSPVFDGHFPGFPTLPGVMMIEVMAQAAGYLLIRRMRGASMPVLAAVDGVRFRSFVRPGDVLTSHARLTHEGSGYAALSTRLYRDSQLLTEALLRLRILPFVNEEMRAYVEGLLRSHGVADAIAPQIVAETAA